MVNGNENGTIAKLTGMRKRFMADFQGLAAQFRIDVSSLREKYLNEIIDLTMSDAKVAEVQRALEFFKPSSAPSPVIVIPPAGPATLLTPPTEVPPDVAPTVLSPEKQPMKTSRRSAYGSCPNCSSPIWEPQAKFCAQCAYPLQEL